MNNERILSISGKPGLYRLISQGRNMLIVENISTGKRQPTYPHERVISLADISIYTEGGNDVPLGKVLQTVADANECKPVDVSKVADDQLREDFARYLPDYDRERVYTTDIRKLLSWYNQLIGAGIKEFAPAEKPEEGADQADAAKADKAE